MKKNMIGLITVGVCICFIIAIAINFPTSNEPKPDAKAVQNLFIFTLANYHPEPQERLNYIIDTLSLPFLCAILYYSLSRLFSRLKLNKFGKLYWFLALEAVVISIVYLYILAFASRLGFDYLSANLLSQNPILALALSASLLLALIYFWGGKKGTATLEKKVFDPFSLVLGMALIILVSIATVFNEADPFVPGGHFLAYFDSVVQVFLGKTLLVDMAPQYGLYALLLKPLFKVIGLSVLNFTLVMAGLKALAYLSIFLLLRRATRSKLIAFIGFGTIIFFTCTLGVVSIGTDPFFQYDPHRLVFPAVFIFLLWLYITERKPALHKILYWCISLVCAISVLWNSDSGLVVMLTWLIYGVYDELLSFRSQKIGAAILKCFKHLAVVIGCTAMVLALFALYTYITSGQWPNLANMALYTQFFYFYGFFMLPMRPIHAWNILALAYVIGLLLSTSFLLDRNGYTIAHVSRDPKDQSFYKITFGLSVLGIGLFNYFVGRSHDYNLLPVSWAALILMTLFMDRLYNELVRILQTRHLKWTGKALLFFRHIDKVFFFLLLFLFFSSSAWSILPNLSSYLTVPHTRLTTASEGMPSSLNLQIRFIESTAQEKDPVFILSDYAPELSLYSQHARPLAIQGFGELVLQAEIRKINDFLSNPPQNAKIYWTPAFSSIDPRTFSNLVQVSSSEDGSLILFESKGR